MQTNVLKGKIIEKYGSQAHFAEALGTSAAVVSSKLCGKRAFVYKDIETWSKLLGLSNEEIGSYFFG